MSHKLYLESPYERTFASTVVASADGWCALDRTLFHPGGGGQPHDRGTLTIDGVACDVSAVREDPDGTIWHCVGCACAIGTSVRGALDWPYRHALMRAHALMHVVNTIARSDYGGVITGVQLGPERSRIDFRLPSFDRAQIADFEAKVNDVVDRDLGIASREISEAEFHARPELVRTLNVAPPVVDGRVRIVEIAGFDAQACGGTHVHTTREIGHARVGKFDNKGKDNKRFYWDAAD
jgi:misacylated tRNA(Ala) deacylase